MRKLSWQVRSRSAAPVTAVTVNDPHPVSSAGPALVMRFAEQAASTWIPQHDRGDLPGRFVPLLVGRLNPISDSAVPSRLGSFRRTFTHGHVRQSRDAAGDTLIGLAERTPSAF
ncbi:hypothetical protein GCM10010112_88660 [Actinoplanes lobatus]|uniref:Uncharacterized protein n=1 Tax=Actinoplanes lobatus TaxID=113568 RepID=A0A7W7MLT8_9ACTN|nr:hypothetical protein [Actinoplanes lobatus]MBB4754908.1 hypothetical protein [Actinoplanes lobatus]GGN96922.1 hypothetical protein GCM10010112_88660 [Actinoplanes lobatus]GIE44561.1 hypothetical protein Alo02nite_74590 [Actinoplanes lobatus]